MKKITLFLLASSLATTVLSANGSAGSFGPPESVLGVPSSSHNGPSRSGPIGLFASSEGVPSSSHNGISRFWPSRML